MTLETILLQAGELDVGDAKKLRIMACIKRYYARGMESKIDLDKLASMSRKELVFSGYDTDV